MGNFPQMMYKVLDPVLLRICPAFLIRITDLRLSKFRTFDVHIIVGMLNRTNRRETYLHILNSSTIKSKKKVSIIAVK